MPEHTSLASNPFGGSILLENGGYGRERRVIMVVVVGGANFVGLGFWEEGGLCCVGFF